MCQWVLKANGNVPPTGPCALLTVAEIHSPVEIRCRKVFDKLIRRKPGDSVNLSKEEKSSDDLISILMLMKARKIEDAVDSNGRPIDQQSAYDWLINAEVMLQREEETVPCTVIQRNVGPDGRTYGTYDDNPYANTVTYNVEFLTVKSRNTENIFNVEDPDGYNTPF